MKFSKTVPFSVWLGIYLHNFWTIQIPNTDWYTIFFASHFKIFFSRGNYSDQICILQMQLVKEAMTNVKKNWTNATFLVACGPYCFPKQKNKTKVINNRPSWFENPPLPFFFSEFTIKVASPSLFREEWGLCSYQQMRSGVEWK